MTPDFDRAATLAAETLIAHGICKLPVKPETIIPTVPNCALVPYRDVARLINISRDEVVAMFDPAKDAVCYTMNLSDGRHYYIVAYNQQKPFDRLRFTLAHELGHILCGHIGVKDKAVREAEADCFGRNLIMPRAMVAMLTRRGIPPIDTNFYNIAGCTPQCLERITQAPGAHVDKRLNRKIRELFIGYLDYLLDSDLIVREPDETNHIVDLGKFMDGYEE